MMSGSGTSLFAVAVGDEMPMRGRPRSWTSARAELDVDVDVGRRGFSGREEGSGAREVRRVSHLRGEREGVAAAASGGLHDGAQTRPDAVRARARTHVRLGQIFGEPQGAGSTGSEGGGAAGRRRGRRCRSLGEGAYRRASN